MLGNLFSRLQIATLRRPKAVLVACLVLTVVAALLGSRVRFNSSRNDLAPEGDPDQRRWEALLQEYGGSETVIACVEAADGENRTGPELEAFADRLAGRLEAEPLVDRVFHRFDVEWLMLRGLYLVPPDVLGPTAEPVMAERGFLARVAGVAGFAELNRIVAEKMQTGFGGTKIPPEAAEGIAGLNWLLATQRKFLEDPARVAAELTAQSPLMTLAGSQADRLANGYMKTRDATTVLLLVSPSSNDDSLPARRALIGALRGHAAALVEEMPGFKVALTGTPAMTVEEMDTVRGDTWRTSIVAVIGVSLLTFSVFRWKTHSLLVLAALAVGVIWAYGAVLLELGYLNMITSAFISTLVGVGVAYGIHPVSEYELEGAHTRDPVGTVRESYRRTGPAVAAAGLTTAVAFFSILLMQFRGFAELGLVAGVGVLLCLLSAMVFLPAMLALYGSRRHRRDRARRDDAVGLDKLWLERLAGRVCRFPRTVVVLSLFVTVGLGWAATGLGFNTNILDLLPQDAESLRYQRRVAMESDLSPVFNFVVAENMHELRAMRVLAEQEPSIDRFDSVLRFLPEDPEASKALIREWQEWLQGVTVAPATRPVDRDDLARSLRELESVLTDAGDAAFAAGVGELAGPLEESRATAESTSELVLASDDAAVEGWNSGQQQLHGWLVELVDVLRRALDAEPPSMGNLPPELRQRFVTSSGKLVAFLFPSGSVFDPKELDAYVAASVRVSETAIGFPFMFHKSSRRITAGFYRAVAAGAGLVFLILLIDLRNFRHAVLASIPLALGLVWALGSARLLGASFNFANLVAVPLVVGVGIDNGVHVIHRVRLEGAEGIDVVLRHTGRAILISSLTTMIGFGSLCLASHRGMASLGLLLLLGVGSCLLASTILLPNLLVAAGICPGQRNENGESA